MGEDTPSKKWWEGPKRVAERWSRECDDPVVREKMDEIAKEI